MQGEETIKTHPHLSLYDIPLIFGKFLKVIKNRALRWRPCWTGTL